MNSTIGVRVLERGVHADAGVGRARTARDEADAGTTGQLALGLGHERRPALLAAGEEADAVGVLVEPVEHGQEALAGHTEHGIDALGDQRLDQDVAGHSRARCHVGDRLTQRSRARGHRHHNGYRVASARPSEHEALTDLLAAPSTSPVMPPSLRMRAIRRRPRR